MPELPKPKHILPIDDRFRMKVGAVIVKKMDDIWHFAYFESLTSPHRGFQTVRGSMDPGEGMDEALHREIAEEYGRPVVMHGHLALVHLNTDRFCDAQVFFLVEDREDAEPDMVWDRVDGDEAAQTLRWRFARLDGDLSFLSRDHDQIVALARERLLSS